MIVTIVHPKKLLGLKFVDYQDVFFSLNDDEAELFDKTFEQYQLIFIFFAKSRNKKKVVVPRVISCIETVFQQFLVLALRFNE